MITDDRKKAFAAAKSAVHAYAKDPTDRHAAEVQAAWKVVKELDSYSFWRRWRTVRLVASDLQSRRS